MSCSGQLKKQPTNYEEECFTNICIFAREFNSSICHLELEIYWCADCTFGKEFNSEIYHLELEIYWNEICPCIQHLELETLMLLVEAQPNQFNVESDLIDVVATHHSKLQSVSGIHVENLEKFDLISYKHFREVSHQNARAGHSNTVIEG